MSTSPTAQRPLIDTRSASSGQTLILDPSLDPLRGGRFVPGDAVSAPPQVTLVNGEASPIAKCRAVAGWSTGQTKLASRTSTGLAAAIGLVLVGAEAALPLVIQTLGPMTATTAEWDAVTGDTGGLTPGTRYFLGTAGGLLATPATVSGHSVVGVGIALSPTVMDVRITEPILL